MSITTYYFDGHIALTGATNWTDLPNAANGDTADFADGTDFSDLIIEGTNAPTTGAVITQVRARIYGSFNSADYEFDTYILTDSDQFLTDFIARLSPGSNTIGSGSYGTYSVLATPTGGWSWTKLRNLKSLSEIGSGNPFATKNGRVNRIEIEVTYSSFNPAFAHRRLLL